MTKKIETYNEAIEKLRQIVAAIEKDELDVDLLSEKVKEANANMAPYKAVKLVKIRNTEFPKNTSRKIIRFGINKSID